MEIEKRGEVALINLRAGRANAMDEAFLKGLLRLFDEVESSDAHAAVLTGYDSYFSAGLALPTLLGLDRRRLGSFMTLFEEAMGRVFASPLPVVAAVNGHAIAGGCVLALQCDCRLAADASIKIGLSEAQLGIGLPMSVIESLRFQVPAAHYRAIALEGALFAPAHAKRLGLVDEIVPPAELMDQAMRRAQSLAAVPRPAYAQIKLALRKPHLERMRSERAAQLEAWLDTWFSRDAQERLAAAVAAISGRQ
jgi:enoyl-CoA hydratase